MSDTQKLAKVADSGLRLTPCCASDILATDFRFTAFYMSGNWWLQFNGVTIHESGPQPPDPLELGLRVSPLCDAPPHVVKDFAHILREEILSLHNVRPLAPADNQTPNSNGQS